MKSVDSETMRELDRKAIDGGIPGLVLMERAGEGLALECALFADALPKRHARRFVILAGKGNNGGDAFVAARLLAKTRPALALKLHCPFDQASLSPDAAAMFAQLPPEIAKTLSKDLSASDLKEGDVIVDGLLGTGVSGAPKEPFQRWIDLANASKLPIIAIDVPSGLDADSGLQRGRAIRAALTVTMALPKSGFLRADGPALCGRVRVVDIGFPEELMAAAPSKAECFTRQDARRLLGVEPFDSFKNKRGHLLLVGGSRLYPGAPALSARAALKGGAGLVSLLIPENATPHGAIPNAVILRRAPDDGGGVFSTAALPVLEELLERASALAIGPGLSTEPACVAVLERVLASPLPCVVDADALNLLAANPWLLKGVPEKARRVFTPHPGEMRRLLPAFGIDESAKAEDAAAALARRARATISLKGCRSVVATPDGRMSFNLSGCPALASAGSGDVLTGLLGAFLANGLEPFDAARLAAFVHGLAGELARPPCASRGLLADEVPDFIAAALMEISPLS